MSDFATLKQSFKGDISTPTDADYAQAISRWALNAQANAKIVAFAKTPEDVALAICYAKENSLPIAVRGGGHSTSGASSSEGLVIDLSRHLNTVEIDPENKLAYVGGGAIWGQVDKAAIQHGLATVAGTVNHTGVGGLTLGGGIGFLCGEHGLVIDNLIKVKIVTANGFILTASETENADLFWGIRGGGCNFGVVTQFVYKLHPQRRTVFAGSIIYTADMLEQVVDVLNVWWSNIGEKQASMLVLATNPNDPMAPLVILNIFYNGSEEEGKAKFKQFFDLTHIADLTKEIPYEELNASLNEMSHHGHCRLLKDLVFVKPHFSSMKKLLDRLSSLAKSEIQVAIAVEFFSYKKIRSIPNGTCALRRPEFNNAVAFATWEDNTLENLQRARSLARELASIHTAGQQQYLGGKVVQGYGNYAHTPEDDGRNRAEILFGENYPRLQELKKKYDPDNVFNKWFAITPCP